MKSAFGLVLIPEHTDDSQTREFYCYNIIFKMKSSIIKLIERIFHDEQR